MPNGNLEDDFKLGYYGEETLSYLYGQGGKPKCCCIPVKCGLPDAITIALDGFWGEWQMPRSGQYHSTHAGFPGGDCAVGVTGYDSCKDSVRTAWFQGVADGLLNMTWYPARNPPEETSTGSAQLCIQNPEMLEFFPGLEGDPPTPVSTDAVFINYYSYYCAVDENQCGDTRYVSEPDIDMRWRFTDDWFYTTEREGLATENWVINLPSCLYTFSPDSPICHRIGAHAGDLNQTAVLRRQAVQVPPVLRPVITRQLSPPAGESFIDAMLLFDVYVRPWQEQWEEVENFDGRKSRFSVDYVCNPRYFPPPVGNAPQSVFNYFCQSPGGIAPPKLEAVAHQGGGGAQIDFTIAPVPGSGLSARDSMWVVDTLTITTPGSGAEEGDVFRFDYYEDPMRGGEYRDSETPQEAVVTSVGPNGQVLSLALVEQSGKRVYYGRFMCHPNGVALRGTGYSEGDTIEWQIVDQPPELGGGTAIEYERARAVVTEVDENGGLIDWYMPSARHGDGDNQHTEAYDCVPPIYQPPVEPGGDPVCLPSRSLPSDDGAPCAENNTYFTCPSDLAAVDCRGLYSDVANVDRCNILYEGVVGFRASAHREAQTPGVCQSLFCSYADCSCGGNSACFNNYCGINTIPIQFRIWDLETRLSVDIPAPEDVTPPESAASAVITITGTGTALDTPAEPEYGENEDDFITLAGSVSVAAGASRSIPTVSIRTDRASGEWMSSMSLSVTHGELAQPGGGRSKNVTITGTVTAVNAAAGAVVYWAPANSTGSDRMNATVTITPPGYTQPLLAKAKASELLDRCDIIPSGSLFYPTCGDEALLDYYLGGVYQIIKGFEYPHARPLGGISLYEVTDPGAGYAAWSHDEQEWVRQSNLIGTKKVHVKSAWDDLRYDLKDIYNIDTYAYAQAEVDLDPSSSTFGQISGVVPDPDKADAEGFMYCIHEYDRIWRADIQWNFAFNMFSRSGAYITTGSFPSLIHKDGYRFEATHRCDDPNLACFGESLSSQCANKFQGCQPLPPDGIWSLDYCPDSLFKEYAMMMRAETLQRPNTPTLLGRAVYDTAFQMPQGYSVCTNGLLNSLDPSVTYEPCEQICLMGTPDEPHGFGKWCEHPEPAVTHDSVCWFNSPPPANQNTPYPWYAYGYIGLSPYSIYLNFGNGPITFTVSKLGDGEERERSVY